MKRIPFHNWLILSLQHTVPNNLSHRLRTERFWMHRFRTTLLNDPFSWIIEPIHTISNPRNFTRILFIRQEKVNCKKLTISYLKTKNKSKLSLSFLLKCYHAAFICNANPAIKGSIYSNVLKFSHSHKHIRKNYYLILPSNIHFNRKFTLHYCKTIWFRYLDKDIAFFIFKHLKISFRPSRTLKSIINNSKQFIKKVNLMNPSIWFNTTCPCGNFPMLTKNDHVCIKPKNIPKSESFSDLRFILLLNAKDPVLIDETTHQQKSIFAFSTFLKQFSIHPTEEELNHLAQYNNQLHFLRKCPIPINTVESIIKPFTSLVFSNLDKDENNWVIMCPKLYLQMYYDHFKIDNKTYSFSNFSTITFPKFLKSKALFYNLGAIANLKPNPSINYAYLIKKAKDLKRTRPIVSYFHNIAKSCGKNISRALNVLIKKLNQIWITMDIFKIDQILTKLRQLNSKGLWSELLHKKLVTFLEFDIKEQYTSLNREDVLHALICALNAITKRFNVTCVSIHRKKSQKFKDKLGKDNSLSMRTISFDQILNYVKFELETSHFMVGSSLIQQINGLPMGALTSAALAVIFCMYREHTHHFLWKQFPYRSLALRYRDDIRFIFGSHLSQFQIDQFHKTLQYIYGSNLTIKIENYSYTSFNFVGITISYLKKRFLFFLANKNFSFNESLSHVHLTSTKTRFPNISSEWPSSILSSVVFSSFFNALHTASEPIAFLLSFTLLSIEFLSKDYKISWLTSAVYKLNIHYSSTCIGILNFITTNPTLTSISL